MKFAINTSVFDQFPELESDRLRFRQLTMRDAETLFEIRSNPHVMRFMDTESMQSIADAEDLIKYLNESFKTRTGINWAIEEKSTNAFTGYFGIWRIDAKHCRGEIGYALHPDYWGKGYMSEAATRLIEFGFRDLNLHSIEANVNPENQSSIKLLEKTGFRKEAYFRENYLFNNEFKDSVIYSLLVSDLDRK